MPGEELVSLHADRLAPAPSRGMGATWPDEGAVFMDGVGILGTGSYLPERVVTNTELAERVPGADPEWIARKTLIEGRRFAAPTEATSDLAARAAEAASTADRPSAAIRTCRQAPDQTPNSAEKPARFPPRIVWPRMKAMSGPGERLSKTAADRNASQ